MNGAERSAAPAVEQAPWCLRFVGGSMRGRALPLKPGLNVIGSAAGSDVLLGGTEVQPRHALLTAGDWAVALQPVGEAPLRLNGRALEARRHAVVPGDRIALGGVEFELDRSGPRADAADPMFAVPEPAPAAAAQAPAAAAPPRGVAARVVGRVTGPYAAAFAASFVAAAALLWGTLGGPGAGARPGGPDAAEFAAIGRVLAGYPELALVALPGGGLRVSGFVESRARLAALEAALAPHRARLALRVHSVETLVDQARTFVADPGVAVEYAGGGKLRLGGASESAATQQKIARLAQDLHPEVLVLDQVSYRPQAAQAEREVAQTPWARWEGQLADRVVSLTEDGEGRRFLQLANGQRVYEGALLKSGQTLQLGPPETPNEGAAR